jgi:hypothetical protein
MAIVRITSYGDEIGIDEHYEEDQPVNISYSDEIKTKITYEGE